MKQLIVSIVMLAGLSGIASAQTLRINPNSAYVFDDRVDSRYDASNYYNGTIKGGYQWGAGIEMIVGKTQGLELKYLRQDATAPMEYDKGTLVPKTKDFKLGINYILLGGKKYFKVGSGKVEPFAGLGLGLAIIDIKNPEPGGDEVKTKFAWDLNAGTNIWITSKVGIRLQLELVSAVQGIGGGVFFGGGGASAGVTTYSTMYQFGMGGGLSFKIGK